MLRIPAGFCWGLLCYARNTSSQKPLLSTSCAMPVQSMTSVVVHVRVAMHTIHTCLYESRLPSEALHPPTADEVKRESGRGGGVRVRAGGDAAAYGTPGVGPCRRTFRRPRTAGVARGRRPAGSAGAAGRAVGPHGRPNGRGTAAHGPAREGGPACRSPAACGGPCHDRTIAATHMSKGTGVRKTATRMDEPADRRGDGRKRWATISPSPEGCLRDLRGNILNFSQA